MVMTNSFMNKSFSQPMTQLDSQHAPRRVLTKVREQLIMFSLENIKIIVQFCGWGTAKTLVNGVEIWSLYSPPPLTHGYLKWSRTLSHFFIHDKELSQNSKQPWIFFVMGFSLLCGFPYRHWESLSGLWVGGLIDWLYNGFFQETPPTTFLNTNVQMGW